MEVPWGNGKVGVKGKALEVFHKASTKCQQGATKGQSPSHQKHGETNHPKAEASKVPQDSV